MLSQTHRDNATIARMVWDATSRGDASGLRELLSPDVTWHSYSSGVLSGVFKGPDGVVDLLARTGELVDGLRSELIDVFASASGAVIHYRVSAVRGLQSLETEVLLRMRIEQRRIVDVFTLSKDAERSDSFWLAQ